MVVNFDMVPFVPDSGRSWLSQDTEVIMIQVSFR
jgi:hypothetical protein